LAKSVFRHDEDSGTLSVFASRNLILLACEHGHYWAIESEQQTMESVREALERTATMEEVDRLFRNVD
jgi:hypothetical protein